MNKYPQYDIVSTKFNGNRCTAAIEAQSTCGPTITAEATITAKADGSMGSMEAAAVAMAARSLQRENDSVVAACIRKGDHKGHQ